MKLYVVYLRTFENSPEVEILSVTTSKQIADERFKEAKKMEADLMEDVEEDSGYWAEACIQTFPVYPKSITEGSEVFVAVMTEWVEIVTTTVAPLPSREDAEGWIDMLKKSVIADDQDVMPYDEDETVEESMHLCNPDVMSDYYFSIEKVKVE